MRKGGTYGKVENRRVVLSFERIQYSLSLYSDVCELELDPLKVKCELCTNKGGLLTPPLTVYSV